MHGWLINNWLMPSIVKAASAGTRFSQTQCLFNLSLSLVYFSPEAVLALCAHCSRSVGTSHAPSHELFSFLPINISTVT